MSFDERIKEQLSVCLGVNIIFLWLQVEQGENMWDKLNVVRERGVP